MSWLRTRDIPNSHAMYMAVLPSLLMVLIFKFWAVRTLSAEDSFFAAIAAMSAVFPFTSRLFGSLFWFCITADTISSHPLITSLCSAVCPLLSEYAGWNVG